MDMNIFAESENVYTYMQLICLYQKLHKVFSLKQWDL